MKNKNRLFFVIIMIFPFIAISAKNTKYNSYKGLIMAGYQGWFNAPDDGAGRDMELYVPAPSRPGILEDYLPEPLPECGMGPGRDGLRQAVLGAAVPSRLPIKLDGKTGRSDPSRFLVARP